MNRPSEPRVDKVRPFAEIAHVPKNWFDIDLNSGNARDAIVTSSSRATNGADSRNSERGSAGQKRYPASFEIEGSKERKPKGFWTHPGVWEFAQVTLGRFNGSRRAFQSVSDQQKGCFLGKITPRDTREDIGDFQRGPGSRKERAQMGKKEDGGCFVAGGALFPSRRATLVPPGGFFRPGLRVGKNGISLCGGNTKAKHKHKTHLNTYITGLCRRC